MPVKQEGRPQAPGEPLLGEEEQEEHRQREGRRTQRAESNEAAGQSRALQKVAASLCGNGQWTLLRKPQPTIQRQRQPTNQVNRTVDTFASGEAPVPASRAIPGEIRLLVGLETEEGLCPPQRP